MIPIMQSKADKISIITSLTSAQNCGGFQAFFWNKKDLQSSFNILNMEQELRPLPIHKHLKYISFLHSSLIPTPLLFRHLNSFHRSNTAEVFISCLISTCHLWTPLMTLLVFEWPKIIMKSAKCDDEDFTGAQSPCTITKPQSPWQVFSHLCIQKCPPNGSIIIETLIKIPNLKDKQIGSDLATCLALCHFKAALDIEECKSDPVTLWSEAPEGPSLTPNLQSMTLVGDLLC